ncbi:MAG: acetylornithine deacetylase [Planctomycetota bacterium]
MVRFDTTSSNSNLPLVDFLSEYVGDKARVARHVSADGAKANLILAFGPESTDRDGMSWSGHMDVVPALEKEWRSDPFELTDGGDRFFGRGTCDMKGFLAVALNVALEARNLKHPLVLVYTYDEEVGTLGARRLVEDWADAGALPTNAIIGEPTSLRSVRLQKGHLSFRIELAGISAHSGYPHLGQNAIEAAARVLVSLRGLRHRLQERRGPNAEFFPEVPYVPLNVGVIAGGSAVNVVPDRCTIEVGARPLPGMEGAEIEHLVREAVRNAAGDAPYTVSQTGESPSVCLHAKAPVHTALCDLNGQQETDASVSFATDAGWLQRAGLECAICGPGSIEVAHKPNEYIPKQDLIAARGLLKRALERFCL